MNLARNLLIFGSIVPIRIGHKKKERAMDNGFGTYLKHARSDETLDLGGLEPRLLAFLDGERTLDDVLPHVVLLAQVEQLPNLAGPLRSQTPRDVHVGQSGDRLGGCKKDARVTIRESVINKTRKQFCVEVKLH
jgi:hypothetical protein